MGKEKKDYKQLKALLKKDLSLLFRKRVAIFIFGGPFILMFVLFGLPSLIGSEQAIALLVFNEDIGYSGVNIGEEIIGNVTLYFSNDGSINVQIVNNFTAVKETKQLGYYIPSNFSELVFTGIPSVYIVDATQSPFTSSYFNTIDTIASSVIATILANRSIPGIQNIQVPSSSLPEEQILGPKAAIIAMPLSYMIFLLIALNSGSNSLIGFAREKRMRTMELLLAYTNRHSSLVISKALTGIVASLGSTLSYILGIVLGSSLGGENTGGLFDIFGFNIEEIGFGSAIVAFIFVVIALLIATLITMVVDTNLNKEAAERISPLISVGLAMFFYFVVLLNPLSISPALMINPFYWCYRLGLLLIAGKINFEIAIFVLLIIGFILLLVYLTTKGIQKEKSLYLE